MKSLKVTFWTATSLIFLLEGVMPALTGHTEMAKEGIRHLGYPEYFGTTLVVFKVLGSLILIIPQFPRWIKEWAYAGFVFDFLFAAISITAVDGFGPAVLFPIIALAVLLVSYGSYRKLQDPTARRAIAI